MNKTLTTPKPPILPYLPYLPVLAHVPALPACAGLQTCLHACAGLRTCLHACAGTRNCLHVCAGTRACLHACVGKRTCLPAPACLCKPVMISFVTHADLPPGGNTDYKKADFSEAVCPCATATASTTPSPPTLTRESAPALHEPVTISFVTHADLPPGGKLITKKRISLRLSACSVCYYYCHCF